MSDGPSNVPPHHEARAGVLGGKGSTLGEDGAGGGNGGRPSARWSIPAAPDPNSGTAVKMGRREAWARFLAYDVRTALPSMPLATPCSCGAGACAGSGFAHAADMCTA